jgi:hypothetical protein
MATQRTWIKSRMIPFVVAALVVIVTSIPIWSGVFSERAATLWTIFFLVVIFLFKTVLFWWMRRRMTEPGRVLTNFGQAILDFFTALILFSLTFSIIFGLTYYYALSEQIQPDWLRLYNRVAIAGVGSLVIGTGVAVAWEMRRIRGVLLVHEGD